MLARLAADRADRAASGCRRRSRAARRWRRAASSIGVSPSQEIRRYVVAAAATSASAPNSETSQSVVTTPATVPTRPIAQGQPQPVDALLDGAAAGRRRRRCAGDRGGGRRRRGRCTARRRRAARPSAMPSPASSVVPRWPTIAESASRKQRLDDQREEGRAAARRRRPARSSPPVGARRVRWSVAHGARRLPSPRPGGHRLWTVASCTDESDAPPGAKVLVTRCGPVDRNSSAFIFRPQRRDSESAGQSACRGRGRRAVHSSVNSLCTGDDGVFHTSSAVVHSCPQDPVDSAVEPSRSGGVRSPPGPPAPHRSAVRAAPARAPPGRQSRGREPAAPGTVGAWRHPAQGSPAVKGERHEHDRSVGLPPSEP